MVRQQRRGNAKRGIPATVLIFGALFLLYAFLGCFGYGNDVDTYLMLRSGQRVFVQMEYEPSRYQGALIPEIFIGLASIAGGHYLCNLVSALLGAMTVVLFFRLLRDRLRNTHAILVAAVVGLNPHFITASSSTMDYVYSLFFMLAGIHSARLHRGILASLMFAFAISSRLSNLPIVGLLLLYLALVELRSNSRDGRILLMAALTPFLSASLYVPAFISSGRSLDFVGFAKPDWGVLGYLGAFLYKNVNLFGLVPFAFLCLTACWSALKRRAHISRSPLFWIGLTIVVALEALFALIPLNVGYLLPLLFVVIPMWVIILNSKKTLQVLLVLTMLVNFVDIDFLTVRYGRHPWAVGADVGLRLKRGILVRDLAGRGQSQIKYMREYDLPVRRGR
jgi:hypothetical protein